jgi:hypothetical protein
MFTVETAKRYYVTYINQALRKIEQWKIEKRDIERLMCSSNMISGHIADLEGAIVDLTRMMRDAIAESTRVEMFTSYDDMKDVSELWEYLDVLEQPEGMSF